MELALFWNTNTSSVQTSVCTNKENPKKMQAVNNGTPSFCFTINRNFLLQESCKFFTGLQGNNSFEHSKDKRRRKEQRQKKVVEELESVRRVLCWVHLKSYFLQWIFYINTFYKILLWRYFLIH